MPRDYLLDMFEELGRILRAIIDLKKSQPDKALRLIDEAFRTTKFGSKEFFDGLDICALQAFMGVNPMAPKTLDFIIDLLLEEMELRPSILLADKINFLINYTIEQEAALKTFSLKRGLQLRRLIDMRNGA
jgi:hypothetical protein